ncbi:uncharacterized protein [Porites lutea]|uniref:uncharacterized protein n=1 Tax=Porites lutea TaxID=51062 RepID=UPI003CC50806
MGQSTFQAALTGLALMLLVTSSIEQQNVSLFPSPSHSILLPNMSTTSKDSILMANKTMQTVSTSTGIMSSSANPSWSSETVLNSGASIISQITGSTKTENNTFFVEFKTEASRWNDDLTKEYHDTYIKTANMIVEIVDELHSNMSAYEGSFLIGFREGVYVSLKLQFKGGDTNNLDVFIDFLRAGGGRSLRTDKVYLKLGKTADCVIAYINTKLCDCMSMTYKRQITCRQPEIYGGKDCPEECDSGHVIAGSISCSWDDLDAMKCNAERVKPLSIMTAIILIYTTCLLEGRLT